MSRAKVEIALITRELKLTETLLARTRRRAPPRTCGGVDLHLSEPAAILHRDIKTENILIMKDFKPLIADLGESRVMEEGRTMTTVGTNGYTAPEVLKGLHYGTAADVFSFAIVMVSLKHEQRVRDDDP